MARVDARGPPADLAADRSYARLRAGRRLDSLSRSATYIVCLYLIATSPVM